MNTISFPGLGDISFQIDRVAFSLFGFSIHWYGIIIAAGFLLAVVLGMRACKKLGIDPDNIIDLVLYAAPVAIICARLFYVVFSGDRIYLDDPLEIVRIWHGGLAIYGGIIGAIATTYVYCRVKKINALNILDFGLPYFALAQAIGRWGNFVNQEAFGSQTNLPWGMTGNVIQEYLKMNYPDINPNIPVHPTFLYESLWNLGVFAFLIWYTKRKKNDGEVFLLYLVTYGLGRFWIEGLRMDSLMIGPFRVSQLIALGCAVLGAAAFVGLRKMKKASLEEVSEPSSYSAILEELNNKSSDGEGQDKDEAPSKNLNE
ncbi:MAG TPA: prolipoprotein diacylglyceryl transferase [Pseudobacteroides sp.]|uniref:prolipoprotein diacylglyceryl transferase n=1 Tax=Pseudobacteroides sp. TaxID=1968840 RepID=UPI002F92BC9C